MASVLPRVLLYSVLTLAPMWALLLFYRPSSFDIHVYAQSLLLFSDQLWAGDLYPRWLNAANGGEGSPVFVFYPPLAFYLASVWQPLAAWDPYGIYRVLLTTHIIHLAGALSCHAWLRSYHPPAKAQTGALFYAVFPYLTAMFYTGYQFPVWLCMAIAPLCFLSIDRIGERRYDYALMLPLGVAGMIMSHLLTALVFAPVLAAYAVYRARWGPDVLSRIALGALMGVGLAAIYWLPAFINKPFLTSDIFISGHFEARNNFTHYFATVLAPLLIVLPLCVSWLEKRKSSGLSPSPDARFWIAVMLYAGFMASPLSLPLWLFVPYMENFQFPFRFLAVCAPALVFLCASWLDDKALRRLWLQFLSAAVVIGFMNSAPYYTREFKDPTLFTRHQLQHQAHPIGEMFNSSLRPGEFRNGDLAARITIVFTGLIMLWGAVEYVIQKRGLNVA